MADLVELTCASYVAGLASSKPAPSGGGTSAFVGALGIALGNMVGSLTVGKPKYADVEPELIDLMTRAKALQEKLMGLVDADAAAFVPLSEAYGLPSSTEEEKARKAEVLETCLHDACAVPLDIMRACCRAIELIEGFAHLGSPLVVSDAGCAAACCRAALQGASLNVYANTGLMENELHANSCNVIANDLLEEYLPRAEATFEFVRECLL